MGGGRDRFCLGIGVELSARVVETFRVGGCSDFKTAKTTSYSFEKLVIISKTLESRGILTRMGVSRLPRSLVLTARVRRKS